MKLTKSDYLLYLDAPRHLWAFKNNKIPEKELDVFTKNLFEQGYEVQNYAKKYVIDFLIPQQYSNTKDFYFEVTKEDDLFQIRIDLIILNPESKKWDVYEIKSTNDIKSIHRKDITFQYLVLEKHYEIGELYILHLNKEYVKKGDLEIGKLFTSTKVTDEVQKLKEEVLAERVEALEILNATDYIQTQACIKPKKCPCVELCHPDLPKYSIYDIARISGNINKVRFLEQNFSKDILDVPSDKDFGILKPLSETQRLQVNVAQKNIPYVDSTEIKLFLDDLKYPLYFIDYESFNPAIPMYDNYKPYDQMPFQYSLHIKESPDSEYIHKEFLEIKAEDPAPNLLQALSKDIGNVGSIIVWSSFEHTQNMSMLRRYPQYSELLENVNSRLWDLMYVFQKSLFVHPDFKGSYSIKKVLPVLSPELSYKGMAIADGAMAMTKWVQMVYGGEITATVFAEADEEVYEAIDIPKVDVNRKEIAENLLRYCELDTWAMVKVLEYLLNSFK